MRGIGDFKKRKITNNILGNRLNNWKIKADEFYRSSEYLWIELNHHLLRRWVGRQRAKPSFGV